VDSIEIRLIDCCEKTFSQEPQSSTKFSIEITLNSSVENLEIRAHCTTHGWSKWAEFKEEPEKEEPKGIPGFPYESVILGLLLSLLFLRFVFARSRMGAVAKGLVLRLTASAQSNAVPLLIDNTIHRFNLDFPANPERTG
jgi:hypothetical protein